MLVTGKIIGANVDFKTGKPTLTFQVNEVNAFKTLVNELNDKEKLSIDVRQYREKRSLDANAYFWVLAGKVAEKMNIAPEEVYRDCVRGIGGNNEVVCVRKEAVEKLCDGWQKNGIGWITENFPSKIEGCINVILYYGSSTYDTRQMSLLISRVIDKCEQLGIETKTPAELSLMLARWSE